jgi:hypothetical protein
VASTFIRGQIDRVYPKELKKEELEYLIGLVRRELNARDFFPHNITVDCLIENGYAVNLGIDLSLADLERYTPEFIEGLFKINLMDIGINTTLSIPNDFRIIKTYAPSKRGGYVESEDYP